MQGNVSEIIALSYWYEIKTLLLESSGTFSSRAVVLEVTESY